MKTHLPTRKQVIFLSISAIPIWVLHHLQYDLHRFKDTMNPILYCIGVVLFIRLLNKYSQAVAVGVGFVFFCVTCLMGCGAVMCADMPGGVRYTSRGNSRLVLRDWSYDCGAWDSSPNHSYTKEWQLTDRLSWISDYGEGKVDTAEWKMQE